MWEAMNPGDSKEDGSDSEKSKSGSDQGDGGGEEAEENESFPLKPVIVAGVMVLVAGAAFMNKGAVGELVPGTSGPPAVEMKETYKAKPDGPKVDHSAFNELLQKHVDGDGWVDYDGFKSDSDALDQYIKSLGEVPLKELGRDQRLATLINAYNAFTIRLILDNQPIESIKKIPDEKRWDAKRWKLGDATFSLSQIEHEQIRPNFKEPRIHFAVVCAAVGCPPLRNEVYSADQLDNQLEEQTQYVHDHKTWFQFADGEEDEAATVKLTKLYKWYDGDFKQAAESELKLRGEVFG